ncbi:MAG: citrate/2-methylcitrate synthase [Pseudomonadota bacterium]
MDDAWLTAAAACSALGIKRQTLYAYVSRGRLRTQCDAEDPRRSQYSRHDVEALLAQRRKPRARAAVARGAIDWGEPVLESSIATVRDGDLYFGGALATKLAGRLSLEAAAAHHWRVELPLLVPTRDVRIDGADAKTRGYQVLAALAPRAAPSAGRTRDALAGEALTILDAFATAMLGRRRRGPIHERLARSWAQNAAGTDLIRRALVLMSDHELNASTFAVRVAASTGAPLAAAALAGFAALDGPLHGEATSRTLRFLNDALTDGVAAAIAIHADAAGRLTGFGHPLYPDGDVRAAYMLARVPARNAVVRAVRETERILGARASVDTALTAVSLVNKLPTDAAFVLFAVGRMAGWLAHAIEQVETGRLIRPRARFVDV